MTPQDAWLRAVGQEPFLTIVRNPQDHGQPGVRILLADQLPDVDDVVGNLAKRIVRWVIDKDEREILRKGRGVRENTWLCLCRLNTHCLSSACTPRPSKPMSTTDRAQNQPIFFLWCVELLARKLFPNDRTAWPRANS
jgi:hypothetical protein